MKRHAIKNAVRLCRCAAAMAIVLLAAACSSDDADTMQQTDEPIRFEASSPDSYRTRAVVNSITDLQSAGFGVFAYYTGSSNWESAGASATPNLMYNQQVTWRGLSSEWTYSPLKYWPNDNQPSDDNGATGSQSHSYVSFFAYAPYNGTGLTLSEEDDAGAPTVTYIWGTDCDLLYAVPQKDCYKTMTTPDSYGATDGRVPFVFKHALTTVEFKVRRQNQSGSPITLNSLTVNSNANTGGTLNLATASWSGQTGNNAQPLNYSPSPTLDVTSYDDATAQLVGTSIMMPGTWTLQYTIDYTVGSINYTPAATPLAPFEMEMGKKYTVMFIIDGDVVESYVLREREAEQW